MEHIVVGVDGSSHSHRALRWALEEARTHGATLVAVVVADPPYLAAGELPYSVWRESTLDDAEADLEETVDEIASPDRSSDVRIRASSGDPRQVLGEMSAEADLLVVGSRGHGELSGLLLGSVSQYLVTHAACPVVVVPGPT